jgi:hypothetical protein
MDRVKAQAAIAAQRAQEAAQQGKERLDQAQATRRGDALLRQLGAVVYAERTGRGGVDSKAKVDQLISDISAHERANGLNLTGDQPPPSAPQPNFPPDPSSPSPGPAQQDENMSGGTTPSPDASSTSFPDAGPSTAGDAPSMGFADTTPRFFPGSHHEAEGQSGGASSFPQEG